MTGGSGFTIFSAFSTFTQSDPFRGDVVRSIPLCPLGKSKICCMSEASILATRLFDFGETGSVRFSPKRSESDGFKIDHIQTGEGAV